MSHPTKRWPVYCPLRIEPDMARMEAEILTTEHAWKSLAPAKRMAQEACYFEVAEPRYYDDCEYVEVVGGKHTLHPGRRTWKGISLRISPQNPDTKLGANRHRFKYDDWIWDERFNIPYVREIVESLPYEKIEIVRVMTIDPPGFGPAHRDNVDDDPWESGELVSTTFTIDYGGAHMQCKTDHIFETDAPVFYFKDSTPHGVPPVTHRRMILRVHGKADEAAYRELMDLDRAVWA